MIKIDLITGFLGSGKTTFIKKYARYWMERGNNIGILENDYGAVNVDMMLLQELRGDNCELEMVAGGCDYDCHRRRFKTKLISMGMCGYDRVLIEPSGIFDVDEFFDVLYEEPLNQWYEIGNVIAIVDANLEDDLSKQSEYLLASQVANAGQVILSRSQEATKDEIANTIAHLNRVMEEFQCKRKFQKEIMTMHWDYMTELDWKTISICGYMSENYVKFPIKEENTYSSLYYMHVRMSEQELRFKVEKMLRDSSCGNIFRVKGFVMTEDNKWSELNATHKNITIQPIKVGQEILIVIGEALQEHVIDTYWKE
ncbi:MAG: GTP-binding protein [Lachnospiraceae bacterium]